MKNNNNNEIVLNKNIPILDLFLDYSFFESYDPVLIKLKQSVLIPNEHGEDGNKFIAVKEMVVSKDSYESFIKNKGFFYIEIFQPGGNIHAHCEPSILPDKPITDKKQIIEALRDKPEKKGLSSYFYLDGDSFSSYVSSYRNRLIRTANTTLIKDKYAGLFNKDIYKRSISPKDISTVQLMKFLKDNLVIKNAQKSLDDYYKPIMKEALISKSKANFILESNNVFDLKTQKGIDEKLYKRFIQTFENTPFSILETSPLFTDENEKREMKKEIITTYIGRSNGENIKNTLIQEILKFDDDEKKQITKDIVKISNGMIKEEDFSAILERCQQDEKIQFSTDNGTVKCMLNWEKISLEDFPTIISNVYSPTMPTTERIEKKEIADHFNEGHTRSLFKMIEFIQHNIETITQYYGMKEETHQSIYMENGKICYELKLPENIGVEFTQELMEEINSRLTEKNLLKFEEECNAVLTKNVQIHLHTAMDNPKLKSEEEDNNKQQFKI